MTSEVKMPGKKRVRIDLTGRRFERLLVTSYSHTQDKKAMWNCVCDCGKEKVMHATVLTRGAVGSCGCKRAKDPKQRILESIQIEVASGCWIWQKRINLAGYPQINLQLGARRKSKTISAHRYSYQIFKGAIPDGIFVCHSCDNPLCVNPAHLWLGSHQDNMDDMIRKGRGAWQKRMTSRSLAKEAP